MITCYCDFNQIGSMSLIILRMSTRACAIFERNVASLSINNNRIFADFIRNKSLLKNFPIIETSSNIGLRLYSKHVKPHKTEKKHFDSDYHSSSDSNVSDVDHAGHRGESEFWRRKMRTFHGILDINNDGVISYDDFKLLADRFGRLGHLSEKHKQEFHGVIKDLWEKLWGEISPYNLVTVERYLENMHHVLNDKSLKRQAHSFLPFLFKAIDQEKSGKISVEDFKTFFKCLGLNEVDAVFSFRTIDTNGDGTLTMKEFVSHGRQFFLTENQECISKYFWGPLVN